MMNTRKKLIIKKKNCEHQHFFLQRIYSLNLQRRQELESLFLGCICYRNLHRIHLYYILRHKKISDDIRLKFINKQLQSIK